MRPGYNSTKHTSRRPVVDVPLPSSYANALVLVDDRAKMALAPLPLLPHPPQNAGPHSPSSAIGSQALPPLPMPPSSMALASPRGSTQASRAPTIVDGAMGPPIREGVRLPNGVLVSALSLQAIGAHSVSDVGMSSTALTSPHVGQTMALTARKPTDSHAGRLAARLQAMDTARSHAAGPVSNFPLHGGAASSRNAAGSAARPPLAIELEAFVKRETSLLARQCPSADALAKVSIGREAFGCFITHFPEYAAALELIKSLYDAAVDSGLKLRLQRHALETENIGFRDYHRTILDEARSGADEKVKALQGKVDQLQTLLDRQNMRQKELEMELNRMATTLSERNKQLDDADARATLFEKAVIELTDRAIIMQQKLSATRRDNERLLHNVAALEQQVRETEVSVVDNLMAQSSARRRAKSIAPGQTLVTTMGAVPAMRNVIRDAVLRHNSEDAAGAATTPGCLRGVQHASPWAQTAEVRRP
jgi:hypothetical protein